MDAKGSQRTLKVSRSVLTAVISVSMVAVALTLTASASAAVGALTQFPGTTGCISDDGWDGMPEHGGTLGQCLDGIGGLLNNVAVAISPDGRNAYVASWGSNAVTSFRRDLVTGALTEMGCISQGGTEGCTPGRALTKPWDVVVSADGRNVYLTSSADDQHASNAVAVFRRNLETGALTQAEGSAGCISLGGTQDCAPARAMLEPFDIDLTGLNAYVAAPPSNAIVVLKRDPNDGSLTQSQGLDGCISKDGKDNTGAVTCAAGRALEGVSGVAASADQVYGASEWADEGAVVVTNRDSGTGGLTQPAGTAGCVSQNANFGCGQGRALAGAHAVVLSPDLANVYVASDVSDAVAMFTRNTNGSVQQLAGSAGCVSEDGRERPGGLPGACVDGRGLESAYRISTSPDGRTIYAAAPDFPEEEGQKDDPKWAIAVFDRNNAGNLSQLSGAEGCVRDRRATSEGCAPGRALHQPYMVAVSPDGCFAYAAIEWSSAVTLFRRETDNACPTPPPPPPPPPPGAEQVAGVSSPTSRSAVKAGVASLGGPSRCVTGPFKITVKGRSIKAVAFKIDGKGLVGVMRQKRSSTRWQVTIDGRRIGSGRHTITGKVTFSAEAQTKSKRLRVKVRRCARTAAKTVSPRFTG